MRSLTLLPSGGCQVVVDRPHFHRLWGHRKRHKFYRLFPASKQHIVSRSYQGHHKLCRVSQVDPFHCISCRACRNHKAQLWLQWHHLENLLSSSFAPTSFIFTWQLSVQECWLYPSTFDSLCAFDTMSQSELFAQSHPSRRSRSKEANRRWYRTSSTLIAGSKSPFRPARSTAGLRINGCSRRR